MEYSCITVRDTYGPICHVVKDRDEYLFRMIDRDEAEQLVNMLNELARLRDATRWRSVGEELPEERRWIPVGERLPPKSSIVLGFDGQVIEVWYGHRGQWTALRDGIDRTPTHWMPLPAPPEKEE